ncbi:MAG: helicase C-terminal domain-containing protein [Bacillota bacterium]
MQEKRIAHLPEKAAFSTLAPRERDMVYVAVDIETTGLDPARDEIIEVGLCRIENGMVTDSFSSLVRPSGPVPLKVKRLTGIDDYLLQKAPLWREIAAEVASFIGSAALIGHNVTFDAVFLSRYLNRPFTGPLLDTWELARFLLPGLQGYSLERVASLAGVSCPVQHRALPDAQATAELFIALLKRLDELPYQVLATAASLLEKGGSAWAPFFKEALKDGAVSERIPAPYAFLKASEEEDVCRAVIPGELETEDFFGPAGRLAAVLPCYEYRQQQEEMAAAVTRAFATRSCLLVEAGTGTGKSLAYLIPLVLAALTDGERALVSTHTVNLQEQLLLKDIPVIKAALGTEFKAVLVKGRQHYLCLRRWERALEQGNFDAAAVSVYVRVLVWLTETLTGDFNELALLEAEKEVLSQIAATAEGCFGKRCPWSGRCFVNKARRQAEKATVLITNHALLLTDTLAGGTVLPDYGPLVIDEAHHLEDVATKCLTCTVARRDIENWLLRLGSLLWRSGNTLSVLRAGEDLTRGVKAAADTVKSTAREFFSILEAVLRGGEPAGHGGGIAARPLKKGGYSLIADTAAGIWYTALAREFDLLLRTCRDLVRTAESWEEGWVDELGLLLQEGQELLNTLTGIVEDDNPNRVEWIEGESSAGSVHATLKAAPICVSEQIHNALFTRTRGVVLTSATLSIEGCFDHFINRVGLDRLPPENLGMKIIDSPFAYQEKAALCVVNDIPLIQEVPAERYLSTVAGALASLITAAGERTLVLFTANRILREVAVRLKPRLEKEAISLFAQGIDGGRTRLIEEFRHTPRAVLCGTASFWEGIDIPGGLLRMIVIVKLPFPPYEAPVLAARRALLADKGFDDFYALSLPYAVLRFKQGFGRLIRSYNDDGVVVVLDRRLVERSYGPSFIRSLPPLPVGVMPLTEACMWLYERFQTPGKLRKRID